MFADIGGGGKYVGITARQTALRSLALCGCGCRAQLGWGPVPLRVKRGRECIMRFLHIMSPTKWSSIEEACSRTAHDLEQTEKQTDQGNRELTLKWLLV